MVVENVSGVKFDELVRIIQSNGEERLGKVLEIDNDKAVVNFLKVVKD